MIERIICKEIPKTVGNKAMTVITGARQWGQPADMYPLSYDESIGRFSSGEPCPHGAAFPWISRPARD